MSPIIRDGRSQPPTKPRSHDDAANFSETQELARAHDAERAKVGLPPEEDETLTPEEIEQRQREKDAEMAADIEVKRLIAIQKEKRRLPTIEITVAKKQPVIPVVTAAELADAEAALNAATAEEARLTKLIEGSKADLDAASLRLTQARGLFEERQIQAAQSMNAESLAPKLAALAAHHAMVLTIHRKHGSALKQMAQSSAGGFDRLDRERRQALYKQADRLRTQLGVAFKASEKAQAAADRAAGSAQPWLVENVVQQIEAALAFDIRAIGAEAERIIAESGIKPDTGSSDPYGWRKPPERSAGVQTGWNPHK